MTKSFSSAPDRKLTLTELLTELVHCQWIDEKDAAELLKQDSSDAKLHPLAVIAKQQWRNHLPPYNVLGLEDLTEWLAKYVKLPYKRIDPIKVDVDKIVSVVSRAYADRHHILPIHVDQHQVIFATVEPFIREWITEMHRILNKEIQLVVANPADIARYRIEFYRLAGSVKQANFTTQENTGLHAGLNNLEQLVELGNSSDLDSNNQHIVQIVDWVLLYAFDQRASDIHLEPRRQQSNIRFRIDGVLNLAYKIPTPVMLAVTSRIKALGRLDIAERRRPQDGRLKTKVKDQEIELRLSSMPTAFGEKLVLRIFNPEMMSQKFSTLGFNFQDIVRWKKVIANNHGIVLVTGPTGSGKTTTLYSSMKYISSQEVNICTIEDPIEMIQPDFNQMQVQHNIDLDFAAGVRTLMRQDPDIIMVGEIRDLETARMAVQAALTGHLVLSTLHTNDAVSAITRLQDIGIPSYLINATLLGVLAQRLVRSLCPHCKRAHQTDANTWQELVNPWFSELKTPISVNHPSGCPECRKTGFSGRIGLFEMLLMSTNIREMVFANEAIVRIREQAWVEGMRSIRFSGAKKIAEGYTSIDEVLKTSSIQEN